MGEFTGKVCEAATPDDKMCKKPAVAKFPKGTWLPWDVYVCEECRVKMNKVRKPNGRS